MPGAGVAKLGPAPAQSSASPSFFMRHALGKDGKAMTWLDVKNAVLQKLFVNIDAVAGKNNVQARDYIAAMPGAANEGLQLLATAGKYIVRELEIAHCPPENLLGNAWRTEMYAGGSVQEYQAGGAQSWYFEAAGEGLAQVYAGGALVENIVLSNEKQFTAYRGVVENEAQAPVRIVFSGKTPYMIRNVALYAQPYENAMQVPAWCEMEAYDLRALAPDFYRLEEVWAHRGGMSAPTQHYRWREPGTLLLPCTQAACYTVVYDAYAAQITQDTPNTYTMPLDAEVTSLLILYMAAEIYKDDDPTVAAQYRNQMETGMQLLRARANSGGWGAFTPESGWI